MPNEPTEELPPGFSWQEASPGDYILTSPSSHRSSWRNKRDMIVAAWDWHYDVRPGVPKP